MLVASISQEHARPPLELAFSSSAMLCREYFTRYPGYLIHFRVCLACLHELLGGFFSLIYERNYFFLNTLMFRMRVKRIQRERKECNDN